MIYKCFSCGKYSFNSVSGGYGSDVSSCGCATDASDIVPLDPAYYPEFEYKSKGMVYDIFNKKKELENIDAKLQSVLEKYASFKSPYFINYSKMKLELRGGSQASFLDLDLFKQVLLNLGFHEIHQYPDLLQKLIKSTVFEFEYISFVNEIEKHIKEDFNDTLVSWIEASGESFRYALPLLMHYFYESNDSKPEMLYANGAQSHLNPKQDLASSRYPAMLKACEALWFRIRVERLQYTLESFDIKKFVSIFHLDAMDGYQFEEFLEDLYRVQGYSVQRTPKGKDQGADLFIESYGRRIVIQAKNYSANIGNKAVQEVLSAKDFYSCDDGVVVANRYFTPSAKELAAKSNIKLVDRDELQKYLEDYNQARIEGYDGQ
jgi:hypothetical protein